MSIEHRIGDVFERLAEIPDDSIDLIVSSPPFLALRSYLPADHPDKHKEIGSEPTPAAFIDTQMALAAEYRRVLAPHGSLCYEIGDTYAGNIPPFGATADARSRMAQGQKTTKRNGDGWPLAKSMCIIPHAFTMSLAYGRNIITGDESPAGSWRIRNVICWARPNPPVGALGDKFRPATSYITVACTGPKRYFDLDAVRTEHGHNAATYDRQARANNKVNKDRADAGVMSSSGLNPAGAPPLDWHADDHPEDGDWLWKMSTRAYQGAHYAAFPLTLPKRLIEAMCPQRVCRACGVPSERVVESYQVSTRPHNPRSLDRQKRGGLDSETREMRVVTGESWTDCGHDDWRTGVVLDPFGGSGTSGAAALSVGRDCILIDLDERNADLARERIGMFLEVVA